MDSMSKSSKKLAVKAFNAIDAAISSVMVRLYQAKAFGDLSSTQYSVLATLLEGGPRSQAKLCGAVFKSSGDIVLVIDNLTKRHLVKREDSKDDRRAKIVHLTEAGRKHIESLVEHHDEAVLEAMSLLNENQLDALMELVGTLAGVGDCEEKE